MTTADGQSWLRRVASAYERGDLDDAKSQCSEGAYQLSLQGLKDVVIGDRGANLDSKTLGDVCMVAERDGWSTTRERVLQAIE